MVVEMPKTKTVALDGTTESGFQYTIPPDAIDDYELLEDLCDIDNGDASKITIAARRLLGDTQLEALKEHVRNENGRVPATKMVEEITQIFNESKVKNS